MCWISNGTAIRKIAERDFYVYKIGSIIWNNIFVSHIEKYQYFPKCPNRRIPLVILTPNIGSDIIQRGYHSYKWVALDNPHLGNRCLYLGNYIFKISLEEYKYCCVGTFIVPKGAEYFENKYGHIVSSDIIYTGKYLKL